ncbi:MAG: c-type cytochrome [Parvularculaceae bacterium]
MQSPMRAIPAAALLALAACGREEAPAPLTIEERGMAEFRACAVCHARTDPSDPATPRLIGPSLFGIVGAPSARLADYSYSSALRRANVVWDEPTLDAFIAEPASVVPGSRMSYAGEPDPAKRAAIIAYLKTLK